MVCERCGKEHNGSYGSGRFCSRQCANARQFSEETKQLKSRKQKQFLAANPEVLLQLRAASQTKEARLAQRATLLATLKKIPFEKLGASRKKLFILDEQGGKCANVISNSVCNAFCLNFTSSPFGFLISYAISS